MPLESKKRKRWLFVILGMAIFVCLGTVYSWSVFKTPFENLYGLNATLSGLPYLVFLLSYTVLMILSGKLVDRLNPKILIAIGGFFVGAGWLLSGVVRNFYAVVFFYGVMSGGGVGIVYGVPIKVVSGWFTKKKGLALGLLLSGFGLSPFITAPIIRLLLNKMGVNQTFIYVGLVFIILIPALGLFFHHPKKDAVSNKTNQKEKIKIGELLKKRIFIGLWICFIIGATVGLMVIGVTSQIGQENFGIDATDAALLISFFAVLNALGRPIFGYLTDKIMPLKTIVISFSLILMSSLSMLLINTQSIVLYIVSIGILWMNLGAWLSIAPTATALLFGSDNYSRNYGVLFSAYGVGALLGTPLAGFIRTSLGSYKYMFLPASILAAFGIAAAFFFMRRTQNIAE